MRGENAKGAVAIAVTSRGGAPNRRATSFQRRTPIGGAISLPFHPILNAASVRIGESTAVTQRRTVGSEHITTRHAGVIRKASEIRPFKQGGGLVRCHRVVLITLDKGSRRCRFPTLRTGEMAVGPPKHQIGKKERWKRDREKAPPPKRPPRGERHSTNGQNARPARISEQRHLESSGAGRSAIPQIGAP